MVLVSYFLLLSLIDRFGGSHRNVSDATRMFRSYATDEAEYRR
ncbi:hypothetical protein MJO55_29060 [Mycolicibacterium rufum]|uniref:Uncharacterized protein n=1 Tax=Mycolicibacterium rufum TaxID=318424 RepID=A0ABY5TSS0_9MYCO|nr:hypothetical protein [Mycolicibacterium rufum]UVY95901.1 hypothetical protein MJO55_29060 [Mycolicibacterium rufum]